jgi:fructose-bisphosphate aldolase class II
MKPLKQLLQEYRASSKAIPAFNIDSFEIYQAVESVVRETGLPCIVALSVGEDHFIQAERLYMLVKKSQIDGLPIYLNMDHGKDPARLLSLAKLGFDMLHFDNSDVTYDLNLKASVNFVHQAKLINPDIVIEVEFNHINLLEDGLSPESLTNPIQATEFMLTTKADLLAVSIGNLHGVDTALPEKIDLDLLKLISENYLEGKFLTLHGGSGVPVDLVAAAIKLGIVKININSDLRLLFKQSLLTSLSTVTSFKVYDYLNPVIADLSRLVTKKLFQFSHG